MPDEGIRHWRPSDLVEPRPAKCKSKYGKPCTRCHLTTYNRGGMCEWCLTRRPRPAPPCCGLMVRPDTPEAAEAWDRHLDEMAEKMAAGEPTPTAAMVAYREAGRKGGAKTKSRAVLGQRTCERPECGVVFDFTPLTRQKRFCSGPCKTKHYQESGYYRLRKRTARKQEQCA